MKKTLPQPVAESKPDSEWLCEVAPEHAKWDIRKANADRISSLYATDQDFQKLAERIHNCAEVLALVYAVRHDTELVRKILAWHCDARNCPICQPCRASKKLKVLNAGIEKIYSLDEKYKSYRWLFLTISVSNPELVDLRQTLSHMNKSWQRLTQRDDFSIVKGWIRTTEVTRGGWVDIRSGEDIDKRKFESVPLEFRRPKNPTQCHPHFHILLFVPPSYFKKHYISHEKWAELWKDCARLNYTPQVSIQAVKTLSGGLSEVSKAMNYSIKPDEIANDAGWFLELHKQLDHLRFTALGGLLKEHIKLNEKQPIDEESELVETGKKALFDWKRAVNRYKKRLEGL